MNQTNHNGWYILDGKIPKPEPDLIKWAKWFEKTDRHVAKDYVDGNIIRISTIFLGLDHSFGCDDTLILFETMIFGGEHDQYQDRYATWEEAEKGHKLAVQIAKGEIEPDGI